MSTPGPLNIIVYDDDTAQGHLDNRIALADAALHAAGLQGSVSGADTRQKLFAAVASASPEAAHTVALVDLEDTRKQYSGARVIYSLRTDSQLRIRCIPAAFTIHHNPSFARDLTGWAFASIAFGDRDAVERIRNALIELSSLSATSPPTPCLTFPDIAPTTDDLDPAWKEAFRRAFQFEPKVGDDLMIRELAARPSGKDTVINHRLADLARSLANLTNHDDVRTSVNSLLDTIVAHLKVDKDTARQALIDFGQTNPTALWASPTMAQYEHIVGPRLRDRAFCDSLRVKPRTLTILQNAYYRIPQARAEYAVSAHNPIPNEEILTALLSQAAGKAEAREAGITAFDLEQTILIGADVEYETRLAEIDPPA